ncbi:hypothetical protein TrVE_jg1720 [Triparma verrucosa]|uniref:Calmodulin n=1 Tax=Triparma verrucosa TaxID=1606542 RepID=A0A9W7EP92_9STRA|nr:hypothetical protein TrVE_jg1720 [Triparma verrucosa]
MSRPSYATLPLPLLHRLDDKPLPHDSRGRYGETLNRFPNIHKGARTRSLFDKRKAEREIVQANKPGEPAGAFHCPQHFKKLLNRRQLDALENIFRQFEGHVKEEYSAYVKRKEEREERQKKLRELLEEEERSVTTMGTGSVFVEDKGEGNWDDDDDSGNNEDDEGSLLTMEPGDPDEDDDVSESELTQKTALTAQTEISLMPIYDFQVKSPLPPCCLSDSCKAFDITHRNEAVVPHWIQQDWDKQEAEKMAGLYGGVKRAEEVEEEEDDGDVIDYEKELDFGPSKMTTRYFTKLLNAVGESMNPKQMKALAKKLDVDSSGGINFGVFLEWFYRVKLSRRSWGGRICITDDAPLPRCCTNPACKAHLERPTAADDDEEEEKQHHIMWSVFARHDEDGSGELSVEEVRDILLEHSIVFDEEKLKVTFDKYDLDHSHMLEFEEFCSLMDDLDAKSQIVQKRSDAYALPEHMQGWFGKNKLEDFKTQFGMFDDNGDGTVDAQELRAVLRALGTELDHDKVVEIIQTIDQDKSGVIEFPEFVSLMRKIEKGEIDVGDSGLAQAVMGSKPAIKLRNEVQDLTDKPIEGVKIRTLKKPLKPPTAEAIITGPRYTAYDGYFLKLLISIPDDYPFSPPFLRFGHRILHINVSMMLDGTCTMPQVTNLWDGGWDLRMLVGYVKDLLKTPDTRLLSQSLREKFNNLPGLPEGYENDYGVDDSGMEAEALRKKKEGNVEPAENVTGFVNLYELKDNPVFPCVKSEPGHDLRTGGNNSTVTFATRALELYFERPAKFKALAVDFCRSECAKVGDKDVGVDPDAIIIA